MNDRIKEVKAARKRAFSMGVLRNYKKEYGNHPLAPIIHNNLFSIDWNFYIEEKIVYRQSKTLNLKEFCIARYKYKSTWVCFRKRKERYNVPDNDFLLAAYCIHIISKVINEYCDENIIKGDEGAEYWLWKFSQHVDAPWDWSKL